MTSQFVRPRLARSADRFAINCLACRFVMVPTLVPSPGSARRRRHDDRACGRCRDAVHPLRRLERFRDPVDGHCRPAAFAPEQSVHTRFIERDQRLRQTSSVWSGVHFDGVEAQPNHDPRAVFRAQQPALCVGHALKLGNTGEIARAHLDLRDAMRARSIDL